MTTCLSFDIFKGEPCNYDTKLFSCRTVQFFYDPLQLFQQEILSFGTFYLTKRTPIESLLDYATMPTCIIDSVGVIKGEEAREVYSRYQKWISYLYHKHRAALANVPNGLVAFIPFINDDTDITQKYGMKCVYLINIKMKDLFVRKKEQDVIVDDEIAAWFPTFSSSILQDHTPSSSYNKSSSKRLKKESLPKRALDLHTIRGKVPIIAIKEFVPIVEEFTLKVKRLSFTSPAGKIKYICEVLDCDMVAQSRKRCKRHGGGPRCRHPGCTNSSQGKGRCRTHGGGKQCITPDCTSGAQQHGFCSRHGGAKLCVEEQCNRHSRGSGLCAFHGGGKRCSVADCKNGSRLSGRCSLHRTR